MIDCSGQQLGKYRLIGLLGHGGAASVYLGQHIFFNTEYAIKVWEMPVQSLNQDALAEARTIVSLKHPHIIPVHYFDVDASTGLPFLVMDYASGGNLRQSHPEGMVLPPVLVCHYVRQVAAALAYAHQRQVVHCDIKPENMLISQQGDILLSDFGIAAVNPSLPHEKRRAQRGLQGTVDYMAPELFDWHPSPKSDQYALAVVTYEWLCGNVPFGAETLFGLIQQHRQEPPPSLTQRMPTLSPEIEKVVFRALAKNPAARFPKIQDFALDLSDACGIPRIRSLTASSGIATLATSSSSQAATSIIGNPGQVPPVQVPARRSARRAILIAGLATGLIALGGGTAWWSNATFWRDYATPSPTVGLIDSKGLLTPGVLLWGADPGLGGAPYVFLDANSAPFGFEVDIANAIAQRMAISQECYQTQYTWLEDNLRSRKIDIILNGWEVTPDRRQDESFSAPYYRYGQQLVVRANDSRFSQYTASSRITLKEVSKYRFGTGADYKAADLLRAAGINPLTSEVPLDDVNKESVDIVMIDTPIVAYYVQGKGVGATPSHTLRPIGKPLFGDSTSNYVIGFKKNDPNAEILRKEIDQVLLALKQDGTLKRIYQQWGLWNDLQKEVGIT
jgi:polar amino acid transport system substrate-binding protein